MISMRVSTGTIQQLTKAAMKVAEAQGKLADRKEVLQRIRKAQAQRWVVHFQSGGSGGWADTSEMYQRRRVQHGNSPTPTLRETGELFSHFQAQNKAGRINAASITWNFSNRAGAYTVSHHEGYELGSSSVPSRMLWDITPEDERYIVNELEDWLGDVLGDLF